MANASPLIAATSTLAMVRTAEARGIETADLLEQAEIAREFLEDPDARIPADKVLGIWDALRERTGDPTLQLAAPATLPFGAYRVIDYIVAASETVGEGIERFARFFGLIAEGVTLRICRDGNGHRLCLTTAEGRAVPPVYVDYVFAALVTRIRMRIRPGLRVRRVELRRPEPPATAPYTRVFDAPVHFDAPADQLCFDADEWNATTEGADAALARLLEEHARVLARRVTSASGFRADVEKAIASTPGAAGSAADVAGTLNVSVRTLQRKLVENGTTFREVSDTVRRRLAEGYLANATVSIAEVAFLLGFSDQSSFNRAFRRWTGESPGRWRRRT
jgi:AraC-like DNA-binding protein